MWVRVGRGRGIRFRVSIVGNTSATLRTKGLRRLRRCSFAQGNIMFRKFAKEEISGHSQVKSSVARGIRANVSRTYPKLEEDGILDVLLPKKEPVIVLRCAGPEQVQVVVVQGEPRFFVCEGNYYPTLRVLCHYPDIMPQLRVDRGAIKYVLSGAQIMCPGLTSNGATIHDEVDAGQPVAIFAEGKENPLAIGCTTLSTADIRSVNKGVGVENLHYLNDGLWKMPVLDV